MPAAEAGLDPAAAPPGTGRRLVPAITNRYHNPYITTHISRYPYIPPFYHILFQGMLISDPYSRCLAAVIGYHADISISVS